MDKNRSNEQTGQSIILVAFLFVAIIIFVAIAVDTTKAYYDRRTAQNAADAAALAAAQELGHYLRGESTDDADVKTKLDDFAARNGAPKVTGWYLDEAESQITAIGLGTIPTNALGVEATAYVTAPTYFGGIIGLDGLPLEAEAVVQFRSVCYGGECLLPIAVYAGGYPDADPQDNYIDFTDGQCYNLWDGLGGANFGWLNWSNQGITYTCKSESYPVPVDDCSADCIGYNLNPEFCVDQPEDMVTVGDKVAGAPGVNNADFILDWLDHYIREEEAVRFVVYDSISDEGGPACGKTIYKDNGTIQRQGTYYNVAGFGAFQITGYRLSSGGGGAVLTDTHGITPESCLDFPGQEGLCCKEWVECSTGGSDIYYECGDCEQDDPDYWEACEYNTGNVNRITGIARTWVEDAFSTCNAVGNFLAPRLTK
jgi:hypothetical protein